MIRWTYVTPRLAVVGALLLLLGHGVDPLLRWSFITGGESTLGAKVEVEAISTSLGHTQISAKNVAIANPHAPQTNAVSADYLWLDVEGTPLTRNRIIVKDAVISGLKINAARESSGRLDPSETGDDSQFGAAGRQWLEDAAKALGEGLVDDLESVRLARELRARWPEEYKHLERRIDDWLEQVQALEQLPDELRRTRGDFVRQSEQVRRAALTLRALKDELAALRTEFRRLHQQARIDRTDLADAAARDVEKIKQRLELARLEPQTLTDYFLGPELGPQTRETIAWVQWLRRQIPASDLPEPQRGRGTDILFPEYDPQPWLLVRSMRADGEIFHRGEPIPFAATASDWTAEPTVHGRPATLRVKTTVPAEAWMELTVDRTGIRAEDRFTFACPGLPVPARKLGGEEYLALHLPAGTVDVRAALSMVDERISGKVELRRTDAPLRVVLGPKLDDSNLAQRVGQRLRSIDELSVVVTVGGTLGSPKTEIKSPLGDQVRLALRGALEDEVEVRRERLAAEARDEIDQEIQALQEELAARKAAVMRKLNLADEQQRVVEQLVADSFGMPRGRLGRTLLKALER